MMIDAGFIVLGLLAGTLHFSLLRWNTTFYARPGRVALGAALQILRLAVLTVILVLAARQGPLPLLLVALGVVIARPVVMRWRPA